MTIRQTGSRGGRKEDIVYSVHCDTCTSFDREQFGDIVATALSVLGRDLTDREIQEAAEIAQRRGLTLIDGNAGVMDSQVAIALAKEHELTYGVNHQIEVKGWGEREKKQLDQKMKRSKPKFG